MERILATFPYELGELSPASSGPRTWFDARAAQAHPASPSLAVASHGDTSGLTDGVRALFVNGPMSVARHVLATDTVTLGRGPGVDIELDDPCVSRVHARLDLGQVMVLTDLGSSNGTTVAGALLRAGVPQPVHLAEPFFIGRSALVVHVAPAARSPLRRLTSAQALGAHLRANAGAAFAILVITRPEKTAPAVLEAILGDVLGAVSRSPRDWACWLDPNRFVLGVEVASSVEATGIERAAVRQLASWGVWAEVDLVNLPAPAERISDADLAAALAGHAPVTLKRGQMIVREPAMHELLRAARRVAGADVGVLILGETGSGKDVLASLVHELSARAAGPFVGVNCASIPEALLESELFGHERGAFTGAVTAKPGLLETADGGTVFLDEIGDLPASLQAKLLRVIESREVTRVGAVRPRVVDVRFVAATNCNIAAAVASGRFRQDLLYRLNCVTLSVPPLRERRAEIEPLVRLFLSDARARFDSQVSDVSPPALEALLAHPWPGNVRELRNVVERAVLLAPGRVIEPAHLGLTRPPAPEATVSVAPSARPTGVTGRRIDRDAIAEALIACGGNQSRAAKFLGVSRRTLVRRIARLGLPRPHGTS